MVEVGTLKGKRLWILPMTHGGAMAFAAVCRSFGVEAALTPPSDERTLELAAPHLSGDECLPEKVTLGDLLKLAEREDFDPGREAIFMPTTNGPCRFGQYAPLLRKVFREIGRGEIMVISPTSEDGYQGIGRDLPQFPRLAWQAVVVADILQKLRLKARPYESTGGETDAVYDGSLHTLCRILERPAPSPRRRLAELVEALTKVGDDFRRIPVRYEPGRPLVGVVGEIFCRLNEFSNQSLIRTVEKLGGEVWLSDVCEWVWYCNDWEARRLVMEGRRLSFSMLGCKLRYRIQRGDEEALLGPFHEEIRGYEEPEIGALLRKASPYLPPWGAMGEMVLSVAKAVYLYEQGADGVIDISPFTCMNGIVAEALYPKLSREHEGFPIKNFFFDGRPAAALERDLGIFLDLTRAYRARKTRRRPDGNPG